MNERLKVIRKDEGLNQTEFGARIGVTAGAISHIEKGTNNLTEQMIIAVCREFGISETWLRTGEGDMRVASKNALIAQLSEQYNLDALDRKILEIYVGLPESYKKVFKSFVIKLAGAVDEADKDTVFAKELAEAEELEDKHRRLEFGRMLTEDEAVALVRQRYSDSQKGLDLSTTLEKIATG